MNVTQPQSDPDGDSSSAGMIVSTAAAKNASSSGVSTSRVSGAAGACAFDAVVAASGVQAASPAAAAATPAPATPAPFKNSRRGSLVSAMVSSQNEAMARATNARAPARCSPESVVAFKRRGEGIVTSTREQAHWPRRPVQVPPRPAAGSPDSPACRCRAAAGSRRSSDRAGP